LDATCRTWNNLSAGENPVPAWFPLEKPQKSHKSVVVLSGEK
jgi:hypothetical protein